MYLYRLAYGCSLLMLSSAAHVARQGPLPQAPRALQGEAATKPSPQSTPRASRVKTRHATRNARCRQARGISVHPCLAGASSSTRRMRQGWSVAGFGSSLTPTWPPTSHPYPPSFGRWRLHGQPASKQGHGGKGRWHCLVNVPLFCQMI